MVASALWAGLLSAQPVGMFDDHSDVGKVLHAGSVEFHKENSTGCAFKTSETLYSGRQIAGQQLPKTLSARGDLLLWRSSPHVSRDFCHQCLKDH